MIIELEVEGQTGSWKNHSELCCLFEVFSIDTVAFITAFTITPLTLQLHSHTFK